MHTENVSAFGKLSTLEDAQDTKMLNISPLFNEDAQENCVTPPVNTLGADEPEAWV